MIAARVATELIIEVRYALRMIGVPIEGPALMLGDNMSVVISTTIPSSVLKKKRLACGYHRVREAIAAGILHFAHIPSAENAADIVDLYGSCQRTSTSLSPGKLPSEIEALTKRTVPSLSTY